LAGIHAEIAGARYECWSSFAPLPVDVVLAAGQKAKEEISKNIFWSFFTGPFYFLFFACWGWKWVFSLAFWFVLHISCLSLTHCFSLIISKWRFRGKRKSFTWFEWTYWRGKYWKHVFSWERSAGTGFTKGFWSYPYGYKFGKHICSWISSVFSLKSLQQMIAPIHPCFLWICFLYFCLMWSTRRNICPLIVDG